MSNLIFILVCTVQECPVEIRRNADSGRCGRRRGRKVTMCGAMLEAKSLFWYRSKTATDTVTQWPVTLSSSSRLGGGRNTACQYVVSSYRSLPNLMEPEPSLMDPLPILMDAPEDGVAEDGVAVGTASPDLHKAYISA